MDILPNHEVSTNEGLSVLLEGAEQTNSPASTSSGRLPSLLCRNSVRCTALITVMSDSSTKPKSHPAHRYECHERHASTNEARQQRESVLS